MLVSGKTFCRIFDTATAWRRYSGAMDRRRPGSSLSQNSFGHYVRRSVVYMSLKGSALVGQMREFEGREVFCVSHHSPASHRDEVRLLRKLAGDRELPAVFAVTEDLVGMLTRLGFRDTGRSCVSMFRGTSVAKRIVVNF